MTSGEEIRHDVDVLRKGAEAFGELSDAMLLIAFEEHGPYGIPEHAWIGVGGSADCRDAYASLLERLGRFVADASDSLGNVRSQLERAASDYEDEEIAHVEELRKVGVAVDPEAAAMFREAASWAGDRIRGEIDDVRAGLTRLWARSWDGESAPVPDPSVAASAAEEAWLKTAPILAVSRTVWPLLDAGAREALEVAERLFDWGHEIPRIGDVANTWYALADKLDGYGGLGTALGSVTGEVLREWSGPAGREFEIYVENEVQPRIPALAELARQIAAVLAKVWGCYVNFWRSIVVLAITTGIGATGTMVAGFTTGPLSAAAAAAAIGAFATALSGVFVIVVQVHWDISEALNELAQLNRSGFTRSAWPKAGEPLGDASTQDGDSRDWRRR